MRQTLEHLEKEINRIDGDNLYQAIADFKEVLSKMLELIDIALPKEVEPD